MREIYFGSCAADKFQLRHPAAACRGAGSAPPIRLKRFEGWLAHAAGDIIVTFLKISLAKLANLRFIEVKAC